MKKICKSSDLQLYGRKSTKKLTIQSFGLNLYDS